MGLMLGRRRRLALVLKEGYIYEKAAYNTSTSILQSCDRVFYQSHDRGPLVRSRDRTIRGLVVLPMYIG